MIGVPEFVARPLSLIVVLVAAALGCGTDEKKLEDLDEPLVWWERSSGLCSAFVAIDRHRSVWLDRGCEAPIAFQRHGEVSDETRKSMDARFDGLPVSPMASRVDCGGELHTFGRRRDGQSATWTMCGSRSSTDELMGLQEPFLGLARAFVAVR
jgi:hypothetical protein